MPKRIKPPQIRSKRLTLVALHTAAIAGGVRNPTSAVVRKGPGNIIAKTKKP